MRGQREIDRHESASRGRRFLTVFVGEKIERFLSLRNQNVEMKVRCQEKMEEIVKIILSGIIELCSKKVLHSIWKTLARGGFRTTLADLYGVFRRFSEGEMQPRSPGSSSIVGGRGRPVPGAAQGLHDRGIMAP